MRTDRGGFDREKDRTSPPPSSSPSSSPFPPKPKKKKLTLLFSLLYFRKTKKNTNGASWTARTRPRGKFYRFDWLEWKYAQTGTGVVKPESIGWIRPCGTGTELWNRIVHFDWLELRKPQNGTSNLMRSKQWNQHSASGTDLWNQHSGVLPF